MKAGGAGDEDAHRGVRRARRAAVISVPVIRSTQRASSLTLALGCRGGRRGGAPELLGQCRKRRRQLSTLRAELGRDADVLQHQRELERIVEAAADDALA